MAAPIPLLNAANAAAPLGTVPVACANVVSSTTVYVGDVVGFGPAPSGCSVVSNSSTEPLDRVSDSSFLAYAAGSGTISELLTDGDADYLNQVNVTVLEMPTPTPTPTPTATDSPSPTATSSAGASTASASPAASGTANASPSATANPSFATTTYATKSQKLTRKDVQLGTGRKPGSIEFTSEKGNPLQLLSVSGDTAGIKIVNRGMNYSNRAANWQQLGYGNICWTYGGYSGVQALVLPVATPPFETVAAEWVMSAAIVGTSSGNAVHRGAQPGEVVDAGGREISTLTVCADGYPVVADASAASGSTRAKPLAPAPRITICHKPGTPAQHPLTMNANAAGAHFAHGDTLGACPPLRPTALLPSVRPTQPQAVGTVEVPLSPTTKPVATIPASASPSTEPEKQVPVCLATDRPDRPYRLGLLPVSALPTQPFSVLPPTNGWTSIIPPFEGAPGQNWPAGALTWLNDCNMVPEPVSVQTPEPMPTLTPTPTGTAVPTPKPTPTVTLSPTPQPTLTPEPTASVRPKPTFTASAPLVVETPLPQPSFPDFGVITPWPPLVPVPVPYATPTPLPTPQPTLTPEPTATSMPTASAVPQPTFTGYAPVPVVSAVPQPTLTGYGPYVVPPVLAASRPQPPEIKVVAPQSIASPTASPTASGTAEPTATPSETASPGTPGSGTVTFVLTNGPSTVNYTTTTDKLIQVAVPYETNTDKSPTAKPTKGPHQPSVIPAGRSRQWVSVAD